MLEEINLNRIVDNYEIRNSAILIFRYDNQKLNAFMKTNLEGVKKAKKINFQSSFIQIFNRDVWGSASAFADYKVMSTTVAFGYTV